MAASAKPSSGGHSNACSGNNSGGKSNGGGKENANGAGGVSATENSLAGPTQAALRHNPGLSLDWTPEEQSMLEDLLAEYASESIVVRYAKISQALRDKTVRDVALRCRWMSIYCSERKEDSGFSQTFRTMSGKGFQIDFSAQKKENGKRRKDENNSRKNKDKKEKVTDLLPKSSQVANRSNGPPYVQSMMSMDSDDGISFKAIGGAAGQLLEQNAQALDQISANFSACKIHENINLFCQARSNILSILNDLSDMPEIMKQMPPLPVKLNDELANSILPRTFLPKKP